MFELLIPFFVIFWGLFISSVYQYSVHYGEAYKLWVQEIVYDDNSIIKTEVIELTNEGSETNKDKAKLTEEQKELFSKIEYLATEVHALSHSILVYMLILFIISILLLYVSKLSSIELGNSSLSLNQTELITTSKLTEFLFRGFILTLLLSIQSILKYSAKINVVFTSKSVLLDKLLFDVWYKHRCFEHRHYYFQNELQPKILYKVLAHKYQYKEKTFDGKNIELSDDLIKNLKKYGLLHNDLKE